MSASTAGQAVVWAILILAGFWAYLRLAVALGQYLHRKDVESQFRSLLQRERHAVDAARKARIDSWVKEEERQYLEKIEAEYRYADAITRDDEPFHLDAEQPTRPAA